MFYIYCVVCWLAVILALFDPSAQGEVGLRKKQ